MHRICNESLYNFFLSARLLWFMYNAVLLLLLLSSSALIAWLWRWMLLLVSYACIVWNHCHLCGRKGTEWVKHMGSRGRGLWVTVLYSSVFNFLAPHTQSVNYLTKFLCCFPYWFLWYETIPWIIQTVASKILFVKNRTLSPNPCWLLLSEDTSPK